MNTRREEPEDGTDSETENMEEQYVRAIQRAVEENAEVYRIPAEVQILADQGVETTLARINLQLADEEGELTGNRVLADNSLKSYAKHYKGLRYFCSLIGDYESLHMVHDRAPTRFCPSMSINTIASFVYFKSRQPGLELTDIDGRVVKDVFGRPVLVQGGWKSPVNLNQFISAVGAVHAARNQNGQYQDVCQECVLENQKGQYTGCDVHRPAIQLWRKGNPRDCTKLQNVFQRVFKDQASHVVRGDSALTPWELIKLRNYCISKNNLYDLMFYVMTLVGCKLFLRNSELTDLKFSSEDGINAINWELTSFSPSGELVGLAFNIKGKTDNQPVPLTLWSDDTVPELCPIRHLLAFIYLADLSDGYIFPSKAALSRGGGIGDDKVPYQTYHNKFKATCLKILDRQSKFGSHSNRKTGYLLAVWGGGADVDIFSSARHRTMQNASLYKRDATYLMALAERNQQSTEGVISKWIPIFCKDLDIASGLINVGETRSLLQVAKKFVVEQCSVPVNRRGSLSSVVESCFGYKKAQTAQEYLNQLIDQVPEPLRPLIRAAVQRFVNERMTSAQIQHAVVEAAVGNQQDIFADDSDDDDGGAENNPPSQRVDNRQNQAQQVAQRPIKKKRGGHITWEVQRQAIKKAKTTAEKLDLILDLEVPEEMSDLSEGARNFYYISYLPIKNCLRRHYENDKQRFAEAVPKLAYSQYKNSSCSGDGESCGPQVRRQ
ncbi:hypothetical protein MP228_008977 [Amoeboaphelidium protococcarum]|nr:hypothetical protein MP228_008977 [Amoeboaphelidium protococcarum]